MRDKGRCYIKTKGSIQKEDITFVNTYTPNIVTPKYMKQMLKGLKGEKHIYHRSRNRQYHNRRF